MKRNRNAPLLIRKKRFKKMGHALIDSIAAFNDQIATMPVTTGATPAQVEKLLGDAPLPETGSEPELLLSRAASLLMNHSLLNGHPKFMGYITSSAAPIGALADLLAAAVNPNVGANILSPVATAIEKQTIRWLSEFIGLAPSYGGLLVSGGNMANFTGFLTGRTAKARGNLKEEGLAACPNLRLYCSASTHSWIEKAAILFGHGTKAIRWIATKSDQKMNTELLQAAIEEDLHAGFQPFMVVATAGDVSTGAVDDLATVAAICKSHNLWMHVDAVYGIAAIAVPGQAKHFEGITEADSIAVDPHKWFYSPLEAGCLLVKDPNHLTATYSSHPVYYNFDANAEPQTQNYYEYGFQNSRGFRALKVWLGLQQAGRSGYVKMISEDIALAAFLFRQAKKHPELEAVTHNLSITTLRYVPETLPTGEQTDAYLDKLNEALVNRLQQHGKAFLSNAVVNGKYCLRACIVNFRTTKKDIREIVEIIVREGREEAAKLPFKPMREVTMDRSGAGVDKAGGV